MAIIKQHQFKYLFLLVFWLFAQLNVIAHDVAIDHSLSTSCEWHCQSNLDSSFDTNQVNYNVTQVTKTETVLAVRNLYLRSAYRLAVTRAPPTLL